MSRQKIEITEHDDAGNITATYIQSASDHPGTSRIDVILPEQSKPIWQQTVDIFLPAGYPNSVTHDYLEYQIYDSLQAFTSSIASLLSSRAVLSSVGVGDSTANPTTALLYSILQETSGRICTIAFAHRLGSALEPESKMYRLLADVLNDLAFILDALSPVISSRFFRVSVLSFSAALRALCGVAAGSAKASLSAHFALRGNLAELNAKDSSQETVISLLGMLVGGVVVSIVTGVGATWATLLGLLAVHLETNRRAVRAVAMRSLNRQRAGLVFRRLTSSGKAPSPVEVAREERIFEWDGVLRDERDRVVGHCSVGVGMRELLAAVGGQSSSGKTTSGRVSGMLDRILELYRNKNYMLWPASQASAWPPKELIIVLKRDAVERDVLVAWWQALALTTGTLSTGSKSISNGNSAEKIENSNDTNEVDWQAWQKSIEVAERLLNTHAHALTEKGWDLDATALETRTSVRVVVERL